MMNGVFTNPGQIALTLHVVRRLSWEAVLCKRVPDPVFPVLQGSALRQTDDCVFGGDCQSELVSRPVLPERLRGPLTVGRISSLGQESVNA
jgi:hypothetical protein